MEKDNKINILIGISGGIAIYKILDLISKLKKTSRYNIQTVMSESATKFVSPQTFSAMTGNETKISLWSDKDPIPHINLADNSDIFLLAPATFNIIGKIAGGIADDLLTSTASAIHTRKIIAPAMNVNMYNNPVLKKNLRLLEEYGWEIIPPDEGLLACNYKGKGKLANIETIIKHIEYKYKKDKPLKGKQVLITAGGTIEDIDPVRYITNRSSGKMGISLAKTAYDMGAGVTLIYANISTDLPSGCNNIKVKSAIEMKEKVMSLYDKSDIIIMSAAVADYRVKNPSDIKIKKSGDTLSLELIKNPDILLELSKLERSGKIVVGFAAETNDLEANALDKLNRKKLDMIVANNVTIKGSGFGSDNNLAVIFDRYGNRIELPMLSKYELSKEILTGIINLFV